MSVPARRIPSSRAPTPSSSRPVLVDPAVGWAVRLRPRPRGRRAPPAPLPDACSWARSSTGSVDAPPASETIAGATPLRSGSRGSRRSARPAARSSAPARWRRTASSRRPSLVLLGHPVSALPGRAAGSSRVTRRRSSSIAVRSPLTPDMLPPSTSRPGPGPVRPAAPPMTTSGRWRTGCARIRRCHCVPTAPTTARSATSSSSATSRSCAGSRRTRSTTTLPSLDGLRHLARRRRRARYRRDQGPPRPGRPGSLRRARDALPRGARPASRGRVRADDPRRPDAPLDHAAGPVAAPAAPAPALTRPQARRDPRPPSRATGRRAALPRAVAHQGPGRRVRRRRDPHAPKPVPAGPPERGPTARAARRDEPAPRPPRDDARPTRPRAARHGARASSSSCSSTCHSSPPTTCGR